MPRRWNCARAEARPTGAWQAGLSSLASASCLTPLLSFWLPPLPSFISQARVAHCQAFVSAPLAWRVPAQGECWQGVRTPAQSVFFFSFFFSSPPRIVPLKPSACYQTLQKRSLCTPDQKLKPVSSFSFSFFFSPPPPPPSSVPLLNGSVGRQIAHLDYNGKDWGALPCAAFAQRCASGFRATCSQAIQSTPLTPIVHLPPSVCGVHFAVESNDCWGFSQGRRRCSWALTHCVDTSSG